MTGNYSKHNLTNNCFKRITLYKVNVIWNVEREDIICQKKREVLRNSGFEKGLWKRRDAPGGAARYEFFCGKGWILCAARTVRLRKSTLLNIIGGIDSADSGYISINGDKLKDMSEKKLTQYRRKHLGYVFQMYNLIANLNVKENIEVGAYLSDNALDIDELLHTPGFTSTATSFQISYPADSSSVCQSVVQSWKTLIYCSATSRQERLITTPQRRFWSS